MLITLPQFRACSVCCIAAPQIPIKNANNFCSDSHPSHAWYGFTSTPDWTWNPSPNTIPPPPHPAQSFPILHLWEILGMLSRSCRIDALEEVLCYPSSFCFLAPPLPIHLSSKPQPGKTSGPTHGTKGGRSSGCGKLQERLKCRHSWRAKPAASAGLLLNQRKASLALHACYNC